jgi:hypothetical protein
MSKKIFFVALILTTFILTTGFIINGEDRSELAMVREATSRFHRTEVAQSEGWDLRDGLDHCFDNQPTGAMGYHYINTDILDANVELLKPESMVYAPGPDGQLKFGAVEYIVDQASWDAANPGQLPSVLGQDFHLHPTLPVYVLHAWIWMNNPDGLFADWNPNVSCP